MNMGKTKIMVGSLDLDLLKRSGKVPCGVCQKGVGSNAIFSCGAAWAGYTRNAVTSKALTLISGAPDTRAHHNLLHSESGRSNRKAMNRNWSNQKANPAVKTKAGNK